MTIDIMSTTTDTSSTPAGAPPAAPPRRTTPAGPEARRTRLPRVAAVDRAGPHPHLRRRAVPGRRHVLQLDARHLDLGRRSRLGRLRQLRRVFSFPYFWPIFARTIVWVVVVVAATVVISLGLAQVLNKAFPGRRIVRLAVIIPWAASVVMTTMVVYYGLEPYFGIINKFLVDIGLVDTPEVRVDRKPGHRVRVVDRRRGVRLAAVHDVHHPRRGSLTIRRRARGGQDGRRRADAHLRERHPPAAAWRLSVAVLINIINVFNSLPILKVMTGSIPGYDADTIMTLIFKYIQNQHKVDVASALSVVAFLIVIVIVAVYVKVVKPTKEV